MKIKTLKSFVSRDAEGKLASYIKGKVYEVPSEAGKQYVAEGLAESGEPKKAKPKKQ